MPYDQSPAAQVQAESREISAELAREAPRSGGGLTQDTAAVAPAAHPV